MCLVFLCRQSLGNTEGHPYSARTIPNIRFHVAIQAEPDCSAADLDSGAKAHSALPGIGDGDTVDLVVGQLLQPVPVESNPHVLVHLVGGRVIDVKGLARLHASNSEPYEWIFVGGIPEVVKSS